MNFRDLCIEFIREAGIAGGPNFVSVNDATGEHGRAAAWVRDANRDIQSLYFDWKFLWASHSVQTVDGVKDYAAPPDCHYWDRDSFTIGGARIDVEEYELWSQSADTAQGRPWKAIIKPDNGLRLNPVPDGVYTLEADYYKVPQTLTDDNDVPWIPESFHDLIWMRAILKYGFYEEARELVERVSAEYPDRLRALEAHQLPNKYRYQIAYDSNPIVVMPE